MNLIQHADSPRYIRLHPLDNVVVVVTTRVCRPEPNSTTAW